MARVWLRPGVRPKVEREGDAFMLTFEGDEQDIVLIGLEPAMLGWLRHSISWVERLGGHGRVPRREA